MKRRRTPAANGFDRLHEQGEAPCRHARRERLRGDEHAGDQMGQSLDGCRFMIVSLRRRDDHSKFQRLAQERRRTTPPCPQ